MGRPLAICRDHSYIYSDRHGRYRHIFMQTVLFGSIQPFHAAGLPVTIPLISLYRRPYSHNFTVDFVEFVWPVIHGLLHSVSFLRSLVT